jgi:hypothetical protein
MTTVFGDFRQFSAGKMAIFLKKKYYDRSFAIFSSDVSQKRHFFADFFGEDNFKNHNIVP